jgi:hypothetical protein
VPGRPLIAARFRDNLAGFETPRMVMSRSLVAVVLVLVALGSVPASAQERPQRFTMTPTEGGFVRLDTETGAVSICTRRDGAWACEPMPEERQALSREIERLQAENKRLQDELRRSGPAPGVAAPDSGAGDPPVPKERFELPTEKDIDQAFDYLEGIIRKFRDRMKQLGEPEKPSTPL